jgi:hypothetical protein
MFDSAADSVPRVIPTLSVWHALDILLFLFSSAEVYIRQNYLFSKACNNTKDIFYLDRFVVTITE